MFKQGSKVTIPLQQFGIKDNKDNQEHKTLPTSTVIKGDNPHDWFAEQKEKSSELMEGAKKTLDKQVKEVEEEIKKMFPSGSCGNFISCTLDAAKNTGKEMAEVTQKTLQIPIDIAEDPLHADETMSKTIEELREEYVEPIVEVAKSVSDSISELTEPLSKEITEKLAPHLKKAVEAATRTMTSPIEASFRVAAAIVEMVGDEHAKEQFSQQAAEIGAVAHDVGELSGDIVRADNALKAGLVVAAGGNPFVAAAIIAAIDAANGKTITTESVLLSVATSYIAGANVGLENQLINSAANGVAKAELNLLAEKIIKGEAVSFNEIRDAATKGVVMGVASAEISSAAVAKEMPVVGTFVQSAASAGVENMIDQYQETGSINLHTLGVAMGQGTIQSGFNSIVSASSSALKDSLSQVKIDEIQNVIADIDERSLEEALHDLEENTMLTDDRYLGEIEETVISPSLENQDFSLSEQEQPHQILATGDIKATKESVTTEGRDKALENIGESIPEQQEKNLKHIKHEGAKEAKAALKKERKLNNQPYTRKDLIAEGRHGGREAVDKYIAYQKDPTTIRKVKLTKATAEIITRLGKVYDLIADEDYTLKDFAVEEVREQIVDRVAEKLGKYIIAIGHPALGGIITRYSSVVVGAILDSQSTGKEADLKHASRPPYDWGVTCDEHNDCSDAQGNPVQTNGAPGISNIFSLGGRQRPMSWQQIANTPTLAPHELPSSWVSRLALSPSSSPSPIQPSNKLLAESLVTKQSDSSSECCQSSATSNLRPGGLLIATAALLANEISFRWSSLSSKGSGSSANILK